MTQLFKINKAEKISACSKADDWLVGCGPLECRVGMWPNANLGAGLVCGAGLTWVQGWSLAPG